MQAAVNEREILSLAFNFLLADWNVIPGFRPAKCLIGIFIFQIMGVM
jgi:hypothetical protein